MGVKRFFDLFFKYMKNGSNIESRKNRKKYKSLTHTYIGFDKWRYKIVSNILSLSVN